MTRISLIHLENSWDEVVLFNNNGETYKLINLDWERDDEKVCYLLEKVAEIDSSHWFCIDEICSFQPSKITTKDYVSQEGIDYIQSILNDNVLYLENISIADFDAEFDWLDLKKFQIEEDYPTAVGGEC